MSASRTSDRVGRVLGGRYRLLAVIGAGASGQVFLAEDVQLHRRVAVKVLHPALAADESFLRRFRAEARAAAALSHPNLMAVYDWGEDDEGPYLVLEHLGGGSLRAMLDAGHRLSQAQALLVGLETARALEVAHRRGIVHRDIKPANLLFGEDGRLRVADFGLARALSEASQTETGNGLVGTARYAAPEQARGTLIDGKADVYALGLVLAEAMTGEVPLTRDSAVETMMVRQDEPVPVAPETGLLGPLLARIGQPHAADRPDADEVGRELLALARQLDGPAPLPLAGSGVVPGEPRAAGDEITRLTSGPDTGVLPKVARSRRRRWPWLLAAVVLLAGGVAGGMVAWPKLQPPTAPVPVVSGISRDDAQARIAAVERQHPKVGWRVVVDEEFNELVAPGVVIRQAPSSGSLKDGGRLTLIVSKGPPPVVVPDLANAAQGEAVAALTAAHLRVGKVDQVNDETVPTGIVMRWRFGGQDHPAQAPKGSAIDLVVSAGPQARVVDDVRGKSEADATAALQAKGLKVARAEVFDDSIPAGQVVSTSPPAGSKVARGSTVTVNVSKGPDVVVVPDVSQYDTLEEASAALEAAGLHLGDVSGRGTRPAASDPEAGTSVPRGTYVNVFLRRR
ncbi:MAG: PASTA domain-containing protein [Acidobacteria bacterium]|nr:PASTA domain-containing protein [Acidobacteriota bacterium]